MTQGKLIFKAEDFKCEWLSFRVEQNVAEIAQRIYDAHIESLPKVEGYRLEESNLVDEHGPGWMMAEPSTRTPLYARTHSARLINIEPIEKKECAEHIFNQHIDSNGLPYRLECKVCGKKLTAKWTVKDE